MPLTQAERATEALFAEIKLEQERAFLRMCRSLGIPPGQPSAALRRLWARMAGESEDAA